MDEKWQRIFLLHSETSEFKEKVKKTQNEIVFVLSKFQKSYIAYSGGKDSCVLSHLILSINSEIIILHWDYGPYLVPRDLESQIIKNVKKMGCKELRILTSPRYQVLKRNVKNEWGKIFMDKRLPELAAEGFECSFIGLRAEESIHRKILTKNLLNHDKCMINAYPLRNWTYRDIYAFLLKNNVPYLQEHYDNYASILGYDKARFVTFFDPDFKHLGSDNLDGILMWKFKNMGDLNS